MGVTCLAGDDEMIVCGYTRGPARAYHLHTGELAYQLQCSIGPHDYDGVQLGLGRTVIVSVTERGWVTVFCRTLYQEKHHAEYHLVNGLKITYSCILTQVGGMAA